MIDAFLVLLAYLLVGAITWRWQLRSPVERLRLEGLSEVDPVLVALDVTFAIIGWPASLLGARS